MYPLVGRDEPLAALRRLTAARVDVAVSGPFGTGRSRLLRELIHTVALPVVWVGGDGVPAADAGRRRETGLHAHVELRPGWSIAAEHAAAHLSRHGGSHVVVVIDDLHLLGADEAAEFPVVATAAWNATVTAVSGEVALPRAVRSVLDGPGVERLVLGGLDDAAVRALADAVAGHPLDLLVHLELQQRTRGLPVAIVELLLGARELGTLEPAQGDAAAYRPLPVHRLVQLLLWRIDRAGPAARDAACLLAFGAPLPTPVVIELGEQDGVRALERHGFVQRTAAEAGQQLGFTHPLYAEVLRGSVTDDVRRGLLGRLVDAFDHVGRREDDLVRVSSWRLEVAGGDAQRFETAAREAYGVGQYAIASRLADRAIAGGCGFYAHLALGASLVELGRLPEGLGVLRTAGTVAGSDMERIWARIASAHAQAIRNGAWDRAEADVADDASIKAPAARAELASYRRVLRSLRGEFEPPEPVAPAGASAGASATLTPAVGPRGRLLDAVADALAGAAQFDGDRLARAQDAVVDVTNDGRRALPDGPDLIEQAAYRASVAAGPLEPVIMAIRERIEDHDAAAGSDVLAGWLDTLGRVQLAMGALMPARGSLAAAAAGVERLDPLRRHPEVTARLAYAAAQCSDRYAVAEAVRRAGTDRLMRVNVRVPCGLAEALVDDERGGDARSWPSVSRQEPPGPAGMVEAGALAFAANHHRWALEAWHLAVRVGHADAVMAQLERLDRCTTAPAVALALRHARAVSTGSPEQLAVLALEFAAAGRRLIGAETAAQAAELGGGERVAALAAGLLACCPGADTPALRGHTPAVLTARQRVIALLALEPGSDAQIAGRLNVSARTVGNHLGRVYRTLGVSGRAQLWRAYPATSPLFTAPSSSRR